MHQTYIFHTRCKILDKTCSFIVDSGSCCNFCSTRLVSKLKLTIIPHTKPYKLQWLNEQRKMIVNQQVKVPFSIGTYKDEVNCDIVPMEVGHILLGRPWQFDRKIIYNGLTIATYPSVGGRRGAHGSVFQGRKAHGVVTNVYSRKTSKKPERVWSTNFKCERFGSCFYA